MIKKIKFVRNFVLILMILCISVGSKAFAQNSIIKINEENLNYIESNINQNVIFFRKFDASLWKNDSDVFEDFGSKMCFPTDIWNKDTSNYALFTDLMRNLMWTENKSVVIVIKNLENFTTITGITTKNLLFQCFEKYILPFWEGKPGTRSVVDCLPYMKPKQFNVYYT